MSKKHVYRIGDKIRILRPRVVERVGYPKTVSDYVPEQSREMLVAEYLLRGETLERALGLSEFDLKFRSPNDLKDPHYKIAWLAAYFRAKDDGFGGKERAIHYKPLTYWKGCRFKDPSDDAWNSAADPNFFIPFEETVRGKRVVKTGTYFAPSGGYDSYTMEYDYEPGGLENMKTHVIILTGVGEFHTDDIEPIKETNE